MQGKTTQICDYIYSWPNFKKNIHNGEEILKYLRVSL